MSRHHLSIKLAVFILTKNHNYHRSNMYKNKTNIITKIEILV
jgi:hypothetical protein